MGHQENALQTQTMFWEQIHPGYRAVYALHEIKRVVRYMEEPKNGIEKLQADLCAKMGWIEPRYFWKRPSVQKSERLLTN